MRWILFLGFLMSANVRFSLAGASIDARFKRDVIDSNKEDMDKLSRLDKKLSFMSNLGSYQKVAGQRRSDEKSTFKPQEAMPAMVTVASPVAPQARMADDSVPIRITTTTAKTAVTPTKPYSEPGKDTLRECLHPKDVNCIKDGKVANLTVGIVHRSDTCDGNSSACPVAGGVELTTTSPKPESGSNKSEPVSALGFLKRMIFW